MFIFLELLVNLYNYVKIKDYPMPIFFHWCTMTDRDNMLAILYNKIVKLKNNH